jgi:hypothetical protein
MVPQRRSFRFARGRHAETSIWFLCIILKYWHELLGGYLQFYNFIEFITITWTTIIPPTTAHMKLYHTLPPTNYIT